MVLEDLSLWSQRLQEGYELSHQFVEEYQKVLPKTVTKIAFAGMGGSGIAGRIIKTFLDKQSNVTSFIIDSSELSESITSDTLLIAISYSGNTWETLDVFEQALGKNLSCIAVTHNGDLLSIANNKEIPVAIMPESLAPRYALGHFLGFILGLFDLIGVIEGKSKIENFCSQADRNITLFQQEDYFADFLRFVEKDAFFHIWGVSGDSAAFAYRAQTQFNENSKVHAVASVFPELCHNLIVGFTDIKYHPTVLFFHTDFLPKHLQRAVEAVSEIVQENGVKLYKPPILGDTFEEQLFNMILWSDFASYYLGCARGVEVIPVKLIDALKQRHKQKGIRV